MANPKRKRRKGDMSLLEPFNAFISEVDTALQQMGAIISQPGVKNQPLKSHTVSVLKASVFQMFLPCFHTHPVCHQLIPQMQYSGSGKGADERRCMPMIL